MNYIDLKRFQRAKRDEFDNNEANSSIFGRLIAAERRYPGGNESGSALSTVSREIVKWCAAAHLLIPSAKARRTSR